MTLIISIKVKMLRHIVGIAELARLNLQVGIIIVVAQAVVSSLRLRDVEETISSTIRIAVKHAKGCKC